MAQGHKSYREHYHPTNIVKVLHSCLKCKKEWYNSTSFGFLSCPYCEGYLNITTRIDVSGGNMPLQTFNGEHYSTRPALQRGPEEQVYSLS